MNGSEFLNLADSVLAREIAVSEGAWARTVTFLLRLALESELDSYWTRIGLLPVASNPMRAQLLCLGEYADQATSGTATSLWGQLSGACHYHAYELSPTADELRRWHDELRILAVRLRQQGAGGSANALSAGAAL